MENFNYDVVNDGGEKTVETKWMCDDCRYMESGKGCIYGGNYNNDDRYHTCNFSDGCEVRPECVHGGCDGIGSKLYSAASVLRSPLSYTVKKIQRKRLHFKDSDLLQEIVSDPIDVFHTLSDHDDCGYGAEAFGQCLGKMSVSTKAIFRLMLEKEDPENKEGWEIMWE